MNRNRVLVFAGAMLATICMEGATLMASVVTYEIPLNYNFHGMAHSAFITGSGDEWTAATNNAIADSTNGYRSIADRGLIFDPLDNHSPAFYSGQPIGNTGLSYSYFNTLGYGNTTGADPTLNGLDIVHLGSRCTGFSPATIFAYEAAVNAATNVGIAPAWNVCDQTNAAPQTTTLGSGILVDGAAELGILYHNSSGTGAQFDVILAFSDVDNGATTLTLPAIRLASADWFNNSAVPAILANNPVSLSARLRHTVSPTTYTTWRGTNGNVDAPVIQTFSTINGGQNLVMIEGIISFAKIVSGQGTWAPQPTVVGKYLKSITFQNAVYPGSGGRGYAIFAASVRAGTPDNADCAAALDIFDGDTLSENSHVPATANSTSCGGGNDTNALWFRYIATGNNKIEARTCGSTVDTTMAVYSTCGGAEIACSDNDCAFSSRVQWDGVLNNSYLIRIAGKNNAVGNFTLHIDDPAHSEVTLPLQFNWNGICHGASEQTLPASGGTVGQTHENRSDLNGYRAIADRGFLCDGIATDSLSFIGTVGYNGTIYQIYPTALQNDMVQLGNRNLAAGGGLAFSPFGTTWPAQGGTSTSDNGIQPLWLDNPDHTGPQTSSLTALNAIWGTDTQLGVLYHMANGGSSFGTFAVTLEFDGGASSVSIDVDATDWFFSNSTAMPAPHAGVFIQRKLGIFHGVQNTDRAVDGGTGTNKLWVDEAIIDTSSLVFGVGFDPVGKTLTAITFENPRSAPTATGGPVQSAFGIFAATLRDPESFNLNFGPEGVGTVTPNQIVAGSTGKMTVVVSRGSGSPNNITSVEVDATAVGLGSNLALNDSGANGDVMANDNTWSADISFPVNTFADGFSLPFTVTDVQNRTDNGNIIFSIIAPTGSLTPANPVIGSEPLATVAMSTNSQPTPGIDSVTVDASLFFGSSTLPLNDSGLNGDVTANDGIYSSRVRVPLDAFQAPTSLSFLVTDNAFNTYFGTTNPVTPAAPTASISPTQGFEGTTAKYVVNLSGGGLSATLITSVTVNAASIGLSSTLPLNDSGTGGDVTADDGLWSADLTVPIGATPGPTALNYVIEDSLFAQYFGSVNFTVASITDLGTLTTGLTTVDDALNSGAINWYMFTLASDVNPASLNFLDIDSEGSNLTGGTNPQDTFIGLYRANGTLVNSDDDDGSGFLSQLTYGATSPARSAVGNGLAYNGRDGSLVAGTYFLAATSFPATFGATSFNVSTTATSTGTLRVNFALGNVPAGGPPAVFTDLGPIGTTPVSSTQALSSGGVQWFKFSVPTTIDAANPNRTYLDIDTENSELADTTIGLFRDDGSGTLVSSDNDDGSGAWSQLTYGRGTRPAPGDGLPYNGRDGTTLAAGTYYLAVTEFAATFGNNFIVFFNTGTNVGNVTVNIRSGFQTPIIHGPVTNPANDHDYYLIDTGFTWTQAEDFAVNNLGGHLVTISDADENEWVRFNVLLFDSTDRRGFIGFNDEIVEGNFVWSSGELVTFTNWSSGEPNNFGGTEDYAEMLGSNGLWNDVNLAGVTAGDFAMIEVGSTDFMLGDMNCDNVLNINDVAAFAIAALDPANYAIQYPGCDITRGDFDNDTFVTGADIQQFTDLLVP
ncbi:MAG: hypothetical protein IPK83_02520 [Planctomycetes bacterium]|nr:hypothetical protein [Planctomycetota bacterium]